MNTNIDSKRIEEIRFDRLVDGELNEAERRELLARLDSEPSGWRRCALAFLESQCWRETLGPIARQDLPMISAQKPSLSSRSRWHNRMVTMLAMATCFLFVFSVVSHLQKNGLERSGSTGDIASSRPIHIVPTLPSNKAAEMSPQTPAATNPWRMVTVAAPAGESLKVPAIERNNIDQQWLSNLPPAIPEDVRQAFSRTGHQIEQHRELVPVSLQDGRRAVVPVDQVDIHYVGNGAY
jgi:hypothetical protein